MLNFFKKTGRGSSKPDEVAHTSSSNAATTSVIDEMLLEAERFCKENTANSAILDDNPIRFIVTNPNALSHFVQFLDSRSDGAATLSLVKFWLDADSFRTAASAEHQLDFCAAASARNAPRTLTKSVSLDDAAAVVSGPLTDDEKSHVRRTARRRFQTSLATDAVRIFRKYLTTKSPHPVDVPATVLARISLALGGVGGTLREDDEDADGDDDDADECARTRSSRDDTTATPPTASGDSTRLSNIFESAQRHVLVQLERTHLDAFVESQFYAKHCIDVLTGDTMHMTDILQCQSALFYLAEFLEQDGRRTLLEFWVAAKNFRQQLLAAAAIEDDDACDGDGCSQRSEDGADLEQAQSDALVLYDRYFSLQAPAAHRLGLSDAQRSLVEQQICTTHRAVLAGCFDGGRRVVERYLEQKYFRAFVTSPLFGRYLAELLRKIDAPDGAARSAAAVAPGTRVPSVGPSATEQRPTSQHTQPPSTTAAVVPPTRHRKSASVSSICTQNTLLATDTRSRIVAAKALTASSMQIDGRQLSDPEALWRRGRPSAADCGRLCFGRVNAMGRYERDFDVHAGSTAAGDHQPHGDGGGAVAQLATAAAAPATASSSLMKAVRRLVRMPEDRAKEDLAWEVAEMIVRDITNVTLRGQIGDGDADDDAAGGK